MHIAFVSARGVLLVVVGIFLLASPAQATSPRSASVVICDQDATWRRPSPEAMAQGAWQVPRYVNPLSGTVSPDELDFYTGHFFAFIQTRADVINRALDLTGLAEAHSHLCGQGNQGIQILGSPITVWIFGNTLWAASRDGDTLDLTVVPSSTPDEGYVILEAPTAGRIVIASTAGQDLAQFDLAHTTAASLTAREPLPDGAIPADFPRPANGQAVLDGVDSLHVETIEGEPQGTYARYLVLVPPGATPLQALQHYAAALRTAGFQVDPIAIDPEAEAFAFTFSARPMSGHLVTAGRILAPRYPDPSVPGAIPVSLFLSYAGENGHLPRSGGTPGTVLLGSGIVGLALLAAGLATRPRAA